MTDNRPPDDPATTTPGGPSVTVPPAEPIAPWFGGKRYLSKRIIERIERIEHRCYAEPFVGMGGVFLRRRRKPPSEIINDLNGEVVNLFRIVKEHPDELMRQFGYLITARAEFARLLSVPAATLTDVQRAARFAYLQRLAFGGKAANLATPGQLGFSVHRPARLNTARLRRLIDAAHGRLEGVQIEQLNWDAFIERYDRPFTLFYIDPPYWGHEADYGKNLFSRADFARLAGVLRDLEGRFILSLNDTPEVRACFAGFDLEAVTTRYSANIKADRTAAELLISN